MSRTGSLWKVAVLCLATLVAFTAFTGGFYSYGLFSDSGTATASFRSAANFGTAGNTGPGYAYAGNQGSGSLTAAGNQPGRPVSITLEPLTAESGNRHVAVGEETAYRVVVTGATNNITAYNLKFALSDPAVANFESFTHVEAADTTNKTVTGGEIVASAGIGDLHGIEGPGVYLGTIVVAGNSTGRTTLEVVGVDEGTVRLVDDQPEVYNITSVDTRVLIVDEANETNDTG